MVGVILLGLLAVLILGGNLAFVLWYYSGRGQTPTEGLVNHPDGGFHYLDADELLEELGKASRAGREEEDGVTTGV